jgi:glycosyltransferase A (GT-A) superfamily protein (DUF2064 family)
MTTARVLVVAKSPVPGRVKTRVGADVGMELAAELAAAALLDTLRSCVAAVGVDRCRLALEGDIADSPYAARLTASLEDWGVLAQRGVGLAERLAFSHLDLVAEADGPVVQIGMDTPQVTADDLVDLINLLAEHDAVLADAEDGGWWALGLRDPRRAEHLVGVPMSTPHTAALTRAAFEGAGLSVGHAPVLRDVDTLEDADAVAADCGEGSEFAALWRRSRD